MPTATASRPTRTWAVASFEERVVVLGSGRTTLLARVAEGTTGMRLAFVATRPPA
jgi:hypothetical protein